MFNNEKKISAKAVIFSRFLMKSMYVLNSLILILCVDKKNRGQEKPGKK